MINELSVLERATINFPRNLDIGELTKLFAFVHEKGNLEIKYNLILERTWFYDHESKVSKYGERPKDVSGNINTIILNTTGSTPFTAESFSCNRNYNDDGKIYSNLSFNTIPGYDIEEHKKETVELWDNVKKIVEEYFKK